ncbi:MAG: hypothetical protein ACM3PA_02055 [Methanomassiliicoccales archaeon]
MSSKPPTYEDKIKRLEQALRKAREARANAQASKDLLEKDLADIEERCLELGVKPDELEQRIKEIREEMNELLQQAEALIPPEFFNE